MNTSIKYAVILILVMAFVTYLTRVIPMTVIKKKITNRYLLSFLYYMPTAVLMSMTFPAALYVTSSVLVGVVGIVVAIILSIRKKGLITVALSSCAVVLAVLLVKSYII